MKKIILSCFLCAFIFGGCSNDIADENTVVIEKRKIIQTTDEGKSADENISESDINDLLYREYQSGTKFFAGVVNIAESDVLSLVSNPTKIAVLYNDELYDEIDFVNADITIEIPRDGNYCFLAADENGEITDITNIVAGETIVPEDSSAILLNSNGKGEAVSGDIFSTDNPEIVKTIESDFKTYYEMSDGTWQCDDYSYKYRLVITGRRATAQKDSTFVYLSNIEDITFDQAWKASGFSSSLDDYFAIEDAVFVGWE